ncbi:putative nitrogen fixation protein NifT [Candidatus Methylacidiphilum fumarolicum]|jgi:nitrogen fixation protein NifT|uniref:Nitrogen fixation protein FixU n=2 Tax=Candidatus Methylacidiphilum fumarolicum TaxID=591154 RepID=I0JYQ3_METFB|nr:MULTISPECIES: putative nitrogen fixation protein NifT [Methylacidiphilum (ex Ratnadevi et al. 2023)]MBW6415074.1 putative nitrogen fixation protein NifT [Candidatus Methylacidiphilum fumarolicum]TFE68826.1 putative nitrogen fixation protein FixT [Methylacidiphilum sp. Yel]TFE69694.1 putative nitrogen fixation protein FixT [Candidatus Methylacidiphilum fumarolicum]TFE74849.1 putative nitrogen fixation protein NifT [Candidatus Methylacidiphilum fumarolicum]TFE75494.1 putative nitrogen fixatio
MKIMLRKKEAGEITIYIAKKDLEEPIISSDKKELFGGVVTLANGMKFLLPEMPPDTKLPITLEARKIEG